MSNNKEPTDTDPDDSNNSPQEATPLHLHTLDSLCKELISGRAIKIGEDKELSYTSKETKSILNWYYKNQSKWAGNVQKKDIEIIVDILEKDSPHYPPSIDKNNKDAKKVFHLKSIRAHRIAGLHSYGTLENPPEEFFFEFKKPLTLIQGRNGSGKTSILSAITWCLTGYIYRSQRQPEDASSPLDLEYMSEEEILDKAKESTDIIKHNILPIIPLPPKSVLSSITESLLPLDSWVELTFIDDTNSKEVILRREVQRGSKGSIKVTEPDFSSLSLDPIAREVGTKLPGLLPYIQLDKKSDLGQAVASLTGIKPLEYLAKHAKKAKNKFQNDLVKDREGEISQIDKDYSEIKAELEQIIENNPEILPPELPPAPSTEKKIETKLKEAKEHFEDLQAKGLEEVKTILGDTFDPEDQQARKDLIDNVVPARGLLDRSNLIRLKNAVRLSDLGKITEEEISAAEDLIKNICEEAAELDELEKTPDIATRLKLYAHITNWIKDYRNKERNIDDCPVCNSVLEGIIDDVTKKPVKQHIKELLEDDKDFISHTIKSWTENAISILKSNITNALSVEVNPATALPDKPADLIHAALAEELFESDIFNSCLSPIKDAAKKLCDKNLISLPEYETPAIKTLPESLGNQGRKLEEAINNIIRAIAFSRWRRKHKEECKEAFIAIIGEPKKKETQNQTENMKITPESTLTDRLIALEIIVTNTQPLTDAMKKISGMDKEIIKRREKEKRLELYEKAAKAIEPLTNLDDLVKRQVSSLMDKLLKDTLILRGKIYQSAYIDAPNIVGIDVTTDDSLKLIAEANGTKTSAFDISNASDLRATLLAFLISFWKYLLTTRGGLSLFLLDDPQELFDRDNRRRVANNLPDIVTEAGCLIVTTNDPTFSRQMTYEIQRGIGFNKFDHRKIHPLNSLREHISLGLYADDIEDKRNKFLAEKNKNDDGIARDYVKDLRIYLEERLIDFFEGDSHKLPKKITLSDLINAVRRNISRKIELFTKNAFQKLSSDSIFTDSSDFLELLNRSHHGEANTITFNEVWQHKDNCERAMKLIDDTYAEYEYWLRRDIKRYTPELIQLPQASEIQEFSVPMCGELAAFSGSLIPISNDIEQANFDHTWISSCSIYYLNTHNFGFAGPHKSRAIVDLSENDIPDNSLVIALHKTTVFAGRLHKDTSHPELIVLSSDAEDILNRTPTMFLRAEEVKLLKVIGILFDDCTPYPKQGGDAWVDTMSLTLKDVKIAFRVQGSSAHPLALDKQIVLGGNELLPADLQNKEGKIVAINTSEGAYLKRIGTTINNAPHVRKFEAIGGGGESILACVENLEDEYRDIPTVNSIREILGVIYEPSDSL